MLIKLGIETDRSKLARLMKTCDIHLCTHRGNPHLGANPHMLVKLLHTGHSPALEGLVGHDHTARARLQHREETLALLARTEPEEVAGAVVAAANLTKRNQQKVHAERICELVALL